MKFGVCNQQNSIYIDYASVFVKSVETCTIITISNSLNIVNDTVIIILSKRPLYY